jgi:hypothetical protein
MPTRTVAKANFVQSRGVKGSRRAHAHMNNAGSYYATRPDEQGVHQDREGFTMDEDHLERVEWHSEIAGMEGTHAYRIVLSPGEDIKGDELKEWTREMMSEARELVGDQWVAWVHDDQTDHPHVHIVAFTDGYVDKGEFERIREYGDQSSERILERRQGWEVDPLVKEWDQFRAASSERTHDQDWSS